MSEFREKFSLLPRKPMHAVVEARSMFRFVPRGADEPKGRWLEKAARVFGLTPSQAKKIEYNEVKDLRASRLDAMRAKLNELQQGAMKRRETLDGLNLRLTELRAANPESDSRGTAPAGGRSDGEIPGGAGEGGGNAPVRPAR